MRKLLLATLISVFAISANAQQIDTTCKCGPSVKVQPFKVNYLDTTKAEWLQASIVRDNMISEAEFHYRVIDSNCTQLTHGNVLIYGDDYKQWSGDNIDSYKFVAEKIKVILYKD